MSTAAPRPDMPFDAAPRADRPAEELPTRELLDRVVNEGYAGRSWEVLQDRLGDVALRDIRESISSGTIGRRCRSVGVGILCSRELEQSAWAEDTATIAVALTLSRLKDDILEPGLWDPARGPSLEHFFVACCLRDMANVYRKSLASFHRAYTPNIPSGMCTECVHGAVDNSKVPYPVREIVQAGL